MATTTQLDPDGRWDLPRPDPDNRKSDLFVIEGRALNKAIWGGTVLGAVGHILPISTVILWLMILVHKPFQSQAMIGLTMLISAVSFGFLWWVVIQAWPLLNTLVKLDNQRTITNPDELL